MSAENEFEAKKSSLPSLLAFVAIALLIGILLFWPKRSQDTQTENANSLTTPQAKDAELPASNRPRPAGISARDYDQANPQPNYQRNPAIKLVDGMSHKMPEPPKPPPTFTNKAEEIAYWQKQLEQQKHEVEQRKLFLERATRRLERAQNEVERERAHQSLQIVRRNYENAQAKQAELEKKLIELQK